MENYFRPELTEDQIRGISSIGLAHMGDAVFEVLARAWLCAHGKATGKGLHRAAVALVCAESQAERAERILPVLSEEERAVFRRGRNAQVHSVPAHASRAQYGEATALEALFGWLYLRGETERVNELFCMMMEG
ncbi:MAG: ribonuclease III [Oscillibacter sp.]|nr:ribonuclease III [Oscillibacter sp.]